MSSLADWFAGGWGAQAVVTVAQVLFAARMLVQWIPSERARQVLSPTLFWQLSLAGSLLLCIYGWLTDDFPIILGQLVSYYIYIWNLRVKRALPRGVQWAFILVPPVVALWFAADWQNSVKQLFDADEMALWLFVWGVVAQCAFTLRFVYQWWYSRRRGESLLPPMFWVISLTGSLMLVSYYVLRGHPILILGQISGLVVYARNLMIAARKS